MAAFIHPLAEFLAKHPEEQEAVSYKAHCARIDDFGERWNEFMKTWTVARSD